VEDHPVLADLDLVAVPQDDLVDPITLHIGAVERAHVAHDEDAPGAAQELGVPAGDRDVVQEDVAVRAAAGGRLLRVQQEARARVRSPLDDEQRRIHRQRVDRRPVRGGQARLWRLDGLRSGNRVQRHGGVRPPAPGATLLPLLAGPLGGFRHRGLLVHGDPQA
jgi:hypothetical protein